MDRYYLHINGTKKQYAIASTSVPTIGQRVYIAPNALSDDEYCDRYFKVLLVEHVVSHKETFGDVAGHLESVPCVIVGWEDPKNNA